MGVKAEGMLRFARVNKVTSASLGYPLLVFNKNSTLKSKYMRRGACDLERWKSVGEGKQGKRY